VDAAIESDSVAIEEKVTFCRLCEQLRADRDHPITHGSACPKGLSANEIQDDPNRVVTTPLRRTAAGAFEPVTWETALEEIGARLRAIIDRHGPDSVGLYLGNPAAFNVGHVMWAKVSSPASQKLR